jgi:hypothetical protein
VYDEAQTTVFCTVQVFKDITDTSNWIAPDGSKFRFPGIDAEEEFFDVDDNKLFGSDDEPDDEHYEGFTGNAGVFVLLGPNLKS